MGSRVRMQASHRTDATAVCVGVCVCERETTQKLTGWSSTQLPTEKKGRNKIKEVMSQEGPHYLRPLHRDEVTNSQQARVLLSSFIGLRVRTFPVNVHDSAGNESKQ